MEATTIRILSKYTNTYQEGKGIVTYANGEKYDGEWIGGKKCGLGVYTYPSGAKYDGQWMGDRKNGFGVFRYANGDRYVLLCVCTFRSLSQGFPFCGDLSTRLEGTGIDTLAIIY